MENSINHPQEEISKEDKRAIEQISTEQAELLVDPEGETASSSTPLIRRIVASAIATGVIGVIAYKKIHEISDEHEIENTPSVDEIAQEHSESFIERHPGLTAVVGTAAVATTIVVAVHRFNQYKEEKDQEE